MQPGIVWEENQGIGHSYGYNRNESLDDYKTSQDLILILVDVVARGGNLLLDVGPTADGRIPVIMQQRLTDIGDWLEKNGEAIYGTEPFLHPYQWSEGKIPEKSDKNFMADYNISRMVKLNKEYAHIEAFFTTKSKNLYCIFPDYQPKLWVKNVKYSPNIRASILGSNLSIPIKNTAKGVELDLSSLKPGEVNHKIFVVKLENAL
jgi:alpha-L-fucosidase